MPQTLNTKLKEKIWNGTINIQLTLNSKDSNEQTQTYRFYLTVRRDSYLQLQLPVILNFFKSFMLVPEWSDKLTNWWFEYTEENVPIKWNYPVGLSYDLIFGSGSSSRNDVWELTLCYRDYPKSYIIPITEDSNRDGDADADVESGGAGAVPFLQDYWINQLKQACAILHGSAKPIMSLSKENSLKLWQGVVTDNLSIFNSIMDSFIIPSTSSKIRNIPIRLYLPIDSNNVIQPMTNPLDNNTIGDMLQDAIPELFMMKTTTTDDDTEVDNLYKLAYPVIHGITIPQNANLLEVYKLFMYIDGFLHISIVIN